MKFRNESGRSMVEMLGVLAIIGVLSVGGIAGYTTAMNKYRTNEILNHLSMVTMEGLAAGAFKDSSALGGVPSSISSIIDDINYQQGSDGAYVNVCGCDGTEEPCKSAKEALQKNSNDQEVLGDVVVYFYSDCG